jgi:EXLDI family protein
MMPNKTIYVSDADVPLFDRAQEIAGGNLSAAIANALRRYVESEETQEAGEIIIKVGAHGAYRQQRFQGRMVGKFFAPTADQLRANLYRVYLTNKGNFAVYVKETPNWMGRRGWSERIDAHHYAGDWWHPTSRLEVYPSLDELQTHVPPELFVSVSATVQGKGDGIEDLDI